MVEISFEISSEEKICFQVIWLPAVARIQFFAGHDRSIIVAGDCPQFVARLASSYATLLHPSQPGREITGKVEMTASHSRSQESHHHFHCCILVRTYTLVRPVCETGNIGAA